MAVSEHALRKRITHHGATKREHGDRVAREGAEARAAEAAARTRPLVPPPGEENSDAEDADAGAMARLALGGVATALRQNRLTEARALSQIAASLDRIGGSGGGGGGGGGQADGGRYGLVDMVRMLFDEDLPGEIMTLAFRSTDPDVIRWRETGRAERETGMKAIAARFSKIHAQGRNAMRAELGLEPETDHPDEWIAHTMGLVQRGVLEKARSQWTVVPYPPPGSEEEEEEEGEAGDADWGRVLFREDTET